MTSQVSLAFIGFGEAGLAIAETLSASGLTTGMRAHDIKLTDHDHKIAAAMRARWTMGVVRPDCVPIKFARQFYAKDGSSTLAWRGRRPHAPLPNGTLAPVCFIHYGGPLKNELMQQTIAHWRGLGGLPTRPSRSAFGSGRAPVA